MDSDSNQHSSPHERTDGAIGCAIVLDLLGLALALPALALAGAFLLHNPHGVGGGPDAFIGLGLAKLAFYAGATLALFAAVPLAMAFSVGRSRLSLVLLGFDALGLVGNLVLILLWG